VARRARLEADIARTSPLSAGRRSRELLVDVAIAVVVDIVAGLADGRRVRVAGVATPAPYATGIDARAARTCPLSAGRRSRELLVDVAIAIVVDIVAGLVGGASKRVAGVGTPGSSITRLEACVGGTRALSARRLSREVLVDIAIAVLVDVVTG